MRPVLSRSEQLQQAKAFAVGRQAAYAQVFDEKNQFLKEVFADLEKFCRANTSTFHQDPRVHAVLEGRREVWIRIQDHLKLSTDEFWEKYSGRSSDE